MGGRDGEKMEVRERGKGWGMRKKGVSMRRMEGGRVVGRRNIIEGSFR